MSVEGFSADDVRIGAAYEAERLASGARLAAAAAERRVELGADLVLVFASPDTVRMALEETLRVERIDDRERLAGEVEAFAALLGGDDDLVATLFVDATDPVVLAERLAELDGVERTVSLEVAGRRTAARSDAGDAGAGAFHLLFALDEEQWSALRSGLPAALRVEHPACRAVATLPPELGAAVGADRPR